MKNITEITIIDLAKKTKNNPLVIHINPIGLLRMAKSNEERFYKFNFLLNDIQDKGGNIAIPTYSYSCVSGDVYDVMNTPSQLDEVSEYLRINNKSKRTIDANFSYLLFGNDFSSKHFKVTKYSSFGENSLIEDIFLQDGYLGAIGGILEYLTEIHFLEKKLNVNYRFDKEFTGITIDKDNIEHKQTSIYYCRDLQSNYAVSFVQLKQDLKEAGIIETLFVKEYNLKIEIVKFKDIYNFIKNKLPNYPKYLWKNKK